MEFTDSVFLNIRIGSDFLLANLRIEIESLLETASPKIISTNNFHEQFIETELAPGSYRIKLIQPKRAIMSPICVPFSFEMEVISLTQWKLDQCNLQKGKKIK